MPVSPAPFEQFPGVRTLDDAALTEIDDVGLAEPLDDFPEFEDDAPEVDAAAAIAESKLHIRTPKRRLFVDYRAHPDAIRTLDPFPDELIVSGGGVRNEAIMTLLRQPLGDLSVIRTDELGVPAEAKEAVAFALLGAATLDGEPGNVPGATGASRRVVLGSITPKP